MYHDEPDVQYLAEMLLIWNVDSKLIQEVLEVAMVENKEYTTLRGECHLRG